MCSYQVRIFPHDHTQGDTIVTTEDAPDTFAAIIRALSRAYDVPAAAPRSMTVTAFPVDDCGERIRQPVNRVQP